MMQERTTHGGNWRRLAAAIVAGAAVIAGATGAQAQSAVIYGSLGNFDIANDTGKVCHGFEIDLDGLTVDQMSGAFSSNRYGMPTITSTQTGVAVRYQTTYSPGAGWATRTLPHTVPWFSGQCYQWVAGTYENGGCEHFGTYTVANPTKVTARWMCESDADPSVLVPVDPPTAVPMPTYYVQPPAQPNNPPQLVAEVVAPEPAEVQGLFGNAHWLRSFRVELLRPIALDELMADDPAVVPMDLASLESDWSVIQDEPASSGNGNRRRKRNGGDLLPTTRSVVRRIEMYAYTGAYDPVTNEALCADLTCTAPGADELVIFNVDTIRPGLRIARRAGSSGTLEVFRAPGEHWSFVEPQAAASPWVRRCTEKVRIGELCSTGLYRFAHAEDFVRALDDERARPSSPELYVAPLYNHLIARGLRVDWVEVPAADVWLAGVPAEYEATKARLERASPGEARRTAPQAT